MCGGGGWDPGEATDDTQVAVLVAESLLERSGRDLPDIFARFQRWAASEPKDIGLQTEDVLTNGMPWGLAAAIHRDSSVDTPVFRRGRKGTPAEQGRESRFALWADRRPPSTTRMWSQVDVLVCEPWPLT
jgi:hypothetical protein